jgi:hypothetical protein
VAVNAAWAPTTAASRKEAASAVNKKTKQVSSAAPSAQDKGALGPALPAEPAPRAHAPPPSAPSSSKQAHRGILARVILSCSWNLARGVLS